MINLAAAIATSPDVRRAFAFGKPQPTCCEGRGCPDRTAPLFIVGALFLCAMCRDFRNDLIRKQQTALQTQARWQGRAR